MKRIFLIFCFWTFANSGMSQNVKAFIKDTAIKTFTSEEFKKNETVQLTDTSYHIRSFYVYLCCQENYQIRNGERCYVAVVNILGNSLKGDGFQKLLERFNDHFYIVLDNIIVVGKSGKDEYAFPPGRIDIF